MSDFHVLYILIFLELVIVFVFSMNNKQNKVYLGYEDESIVDEKSVNYLTNKIGGYPDVPDPGTVFPSQCKLCGLQRPLLLQCYAPLPSSPYHRTLYVFACINPLCWNNTNSWSCFRAQHLDELYAQKLKQVEKEQANAKPSSSGISSDPWCSGADEWGNDDGNGTETGVNSFAEPSSGRNNDDMKHLDRMSDSDEDSVAMEELDARVGRISLEANVQKPGATAEIDGEDSTDVVVDEVKAPENNLLNLLCEVPDLPDELKSGGVVQFESKYVAVYEEYLSDDGNLDHAKKLLQQYQTENKDDFQKIQSKQISKGKKGEEIEEYEKAAPRHGNEVFHNFLTRIQMNPGQILRYSLGGQPLPMLPLSASLRSAKCQHCNGEVYFELQILPTIIPSVKITNFSPLEFGTVFIYSCKQSCWESDAGFRNEIVLVQKEPM